MRNFHNHIVTPFTINLRIFSPSTKRRNTVHNNFHYSIFHYALTSKLLFKFFFIYGFPSYYRKSSFCISPCFIINHAHFCLPRCLCIRGIHCPSIVGISCYHLPILIIKFYVLTIARWQFLILYFPPQAELRQNLSALTHYVYFLKQLLIQK